MCPSCGDFDGCECNEPYGVVMEGDRIKGLRKLEDDDED